MSAAYICDKCHALFAADDADAAIETDPFEFWGQHEVARYMCDACPTCGSTELEQTALCDECHEREAGDGIDECEVCFAKIEAHEEALVKRVKELAKQIEESIS